MDFMSRINQIESRIQQLEQQTSGASSAPTADAPNFQQMLDQQMTGRSGTPSLPPGVTAYQPGQIPVFPTDSVGAPGPISSKASDYEATIKEAADKYGVDPNLIKSVIQQESAFNPQATSGCGAQGMMQLMPDTAKELGCTDAYDPKQNIMAGTRYLKQQLDHFGGDTSKALAAYNAGAGNVEKYGGVPPFAETQNYVKNILGYFAEYRKAG